jgi:hypothetical protein
MPSWWDRFGQEWASNGLTDDPTFAQSDAGWAFIGQAPPTVEQFNSMFQWSDDKDNWLYGQIGNVITKSGVAPNDNDLLQLYNAILGMSRTRLSNNMAVYVDATNGNDVTGTGIIGNPWKTIQHALAYLYGYIDPSGWNYIIQLAPGTYEAIYHTLPVNGAVILQGDSLNPRAYVIKNLNGSAIAVVSSAVLYVQGISVEGSGPDVDYTSMGNGIYTDRGGIVVFDAIAFGPCSRHHVWVGISGNFWPWRGGATSYTIYGGAAAHMFVSLGGAATLIQLDLTIQNNPTFPNGFLTANQSGYIQCKDMTYTGTVVNTPKYWVASAGQIYTGGQLGAIIPGDLAGYVDAASYGIFS